MNRPVRPETYEHDECAPFFEGLLPEGDFLRAVARVFHVSAGNPFSVLAEIGGECAGAVGVEALAGLPLLDGQLVEPRHVGDVNKIARLPSVSPDSHRLAVRNAPSEERNRWIGRRS